MKLNMKRTIVAAAKMGLVCGAFTACGGSTAPAESPESGMEAMPEQAATSDMPADDMPAADGSEQPGAEAKDCCKGKNECKGKGGCKTDEHSCKGQNDCKGQGGCNAHCPS
jgi:predicted small lipoprotein YifL